MPKQELKSKLEKELKEGQEEVENVAEKDKAVEEELKVEEEEEDTEKKKIRKINLFLMKKTSLNQNREIKW